MNAMKSFAIWVAIAFLALPASLVAQVSGGSSFGPESIIVGRVGTSASTLSGTGNEIYLDEYSPSGNLIQSIPLPASPSGANRRLVVAGDSISEGGLSRSADGRYLIVSGYDAAIPYPVNVSGTAGTSTRRVIGRVDHEGTVNTATALTDFASTGVPRSVVSVDGSQFWMVGSKGGVRHAPLGATTSTQLNKQAPDPSHLGLYGGWLYLSTDGGSPRISSVGTNLPTTAGQTLNGLAGFPEVGSPDGFHLADLSDSVFGFDTLYVADDTIGLMKFSLVNGLWVSSGTVGADTDDYRGLTAKITSSGVVLFAIRKALGIQGGGELVKLTDSSGYRGPLHGTPLLVATAAANTAFRGVSLAPFLLPDLTVEISGPTHVTTNTPFDYTFTVRNLGNAPASNITVSFNVPPTLVVESGPDADGFTGPGAAGSSPVVEFTNGTLAPGASATLILTCSAPLDGTYVTIPFTPTVDPGGLIEDANNENKSASFGVRTVASADAPAPTVFTWKDSPTGLWSESAKWTNDLANGAAPDFSGRSNYILDFNASDRFQATHDLAAGFSLNRMNFSGSNVIDISNSVVEFTADGSHLPAITQVGTVSTRVSTLIGTTSDLTVAVNGSGDLTLSSGIFGSGSLIKTGLGKLLLTMPSSYTGSTIIEAGTLALSEEGGPHRNFIAEGGFEKPRYGAEGWAYTPNFSGWNMTGTAGIGSRYSTWVDETPEGAQVAFLQGEPSSISQMVTITTPGQYTLKFLGANRPGYVANGVVFKIQGNQVASWDNAQFDNEDAFEEKSQTVNLASGTYFIELAGWNTAGGDVATLIDGVSLTGPSGALPPTSVVDLTGVGATLDIGNSEQVIPGLTGATGTSIVNDGRLVVDTALTTSFDGVISGSGDLVKEGAGTLALGGANTYSGGTNIYRGTLVLNAPTLSDLASVNISISGTLELNFTGTDVISGLNIGETSFPPGIYHSSSSGFAGRITGSGSLEVITPSPTPDIAVETPDGMGIPNGGTRDFGILEIGTPGDDTRIFHVKNEGTGDLEIDAFILGIYGVNTADYEVFTYGFVDDFYYLILPPGQTGTVMVRFAPTAPGTRTAELLIYSDDPDESSYIVNLTGGSPQLPVFTTQPGDFMVDYNSKVNFTVAASGVPAPDYQWYEGESGDTSNAIPGATSASYLTPVLSGSTRYWVRAANASGTTDSATAVVTVSPPPLSEIGVSEAVGESFTGLNSGESLQFGNGSLAPTIFPPIKTIMVANYGSETLANLEVTVTGPDAEDFGVTLEGIPENFPTSLGIGASGFFSVYFTPTGEGPRTATLNIFSNDADENPFALTLTGNGTAPLPVVTTIPATGVSDAVATLRGSVNPNGSATTAAFEFGTSTSYGTSVAVALAPDDGTSDQSISTFLSGLTTGQTYHFRTVASNAWGTSYGADRTFTAASNAFTYTNSDDQLTITGYTGPGGALIIPATIGGLPVVFVGSGAFSNNDTITSVVIPSGVLSIGMDAFSYCSALTSVTIPNTVTYIASAAFRGCTAVTSVFIPESVNYIDLFAFDFMSSLTGFTVDAGNLNYSSLDGVLFNKDQTTLHVYPGGKAGGYTVPLSVTAIYDYAFYYCTALTDISLPPSLQSIGWGAFEQCDGLVNLTIPASVAQIRPGSISDCNSLLSITVLESNSFFTSQDGVLFNEDLTELIQYPAGKSGFYVVPSTVNSIAGVAFINADGLTGITLPAGLTSLGSGAFYSCGALAAISIPGGVASIGPTTFTYCTSLGTVILSEGLVDIGYSAFEGCSSLSSIIVPSTVTSIGNQAFMICTSLTSAVFLGEAPPMGTNVFQFAGVGFFVGYFNANSSGFLAPTWPGYPVTNLGVPTPEISVNAGGPNLADGDDVIFANVLAGSLPGETLVLTIRNTGYAPLMDFSVFFDDEVVSDFSLNASSLPFSLAPGGSSQFSVTFAPIATGVRRESIVIESNDSDTSSFRFNVSGTGTSDSSFNYRIRSGEVHITGYTGPGGVVVVPSMIAGRPVIGIDDSAFEHQSGITSLTLPEGIRSIGSNAFFACDGLTGFTLPDSVTHIGSGAFSLCNGITQIKIPANVSTIDTTAFAYISGLTEFTVDPLNTNFSALDGVLFNFDQSTLLQYPGGLAGPYSIPSGVTQVGDSSFSSVLGLTAIALTEDVTRIGRGAFANTGLTGVMIPANVTVIEAGAFASCRNLLSFDVDAFNADFESVDGVLFSEDLSQLIQYPAGKLDAGYGIPVSVSAIEQSAFFGATHLTGVTMPAGLLTIGDFAFYGCSNLESVAIPGGVTVLNIQTFAYCAELASVTLPAGLVTIGPYAFQACASLINITIPASVTLIEYNAFFGCGNLETATFLGNAPVMGEDVFFGAGELFYVGYYNPFEAGFLALTWPGYDVVNLGNVPLPPGANLANLQVSAGDLTPAFAPAITAYTVPVPNAVDSITLTATPLDSAATVKVNGATVSAGVPSNSLPLSVGNNVITTVVTAADGTTTKTYTLVVARASSAQITTSPAQIGANRTILLKGTVIPNGVATVHFEYGVANTSENLTAPQVFQGNVPQNLVATLSGLPFATTFKYRAIATGTFGTLYGSEETFTTIQEPPVAATGDPSGVSGSAATLVGAVDPRGLLTEVYFEYGLTNLYGKKTEVRMVTSAGGFQDFLSPSGGLIPDAIYHYRIVASNGAGTTYGEDVTFRVAIGSGVTNPIPTTQPAVSTGGFAAVTEQSVILQGVVNPNRGTTVIQFQLGTTPAYGRTTNIQGVGNGNEPIEVALQVSGLLPGTTYQYRLIGANSAGTTQGENFEFTTKPAPPAAATGETEVVSTTRVRVTGSAKAGGAPAEVFIDFGTDPFTFTGTTQTEPAAVTGGLPLPVSGELTNLRQGRIYYYRVRAVGPGGVTGVGETRSFQVGLLSGLIQQFPDAVPPDERAGSLDVVISAILPGAGWRFLGEKPWRSSGTPATGLTNGDRVIEFRPVAGHVQPPSETVAIVSNGTPATITRSYTPSGVTGSGAVNVTLRPEGLTEDDRPFELLAQWAMSGEVDGQGEPIWRSSGSSKEGLLPGNHIIIAKSVTGRSKPLPVTVRIRASETTFTTITYYVAEDGVGTPPALVDFETVSDSPELPYAYTGQLRSDAGAGSGFVVRPGVVATAAHVLFDDGTLSSATNMQWLHRQDQKVHDPVPLIPRGYFMLTGYAAQRAVDNSPGSSTPESQNLDAAAAYFLSDPGGGGFSGYLASDLADNEFLLSDALKTLVGYPVDGTTDLNVNRMHATPTADVNFARGFGKTYVTSDIRSSGGGSGGPLCVQYENGIYYPAAIYLGGTAQTVVRAIDSSVADLIGFAEASATLRAGNTGGEITSTHEEPNGDPATGALQVTIEPAAARAAGAGWRIQSASPYLASGSGLNGLTPNNYVIQFASVPGFVPPTSQGVAIQGGFRKNITFSYEEIVLPPVIGSQTEIAGVRGQPFFYQIEASNSPTGYSLLGGLPAGLEFDGNSGQVSGTPEEAGLFTVLIGAENSGGADSRSLSISSLPELFDQTVSVPFNQPMSYGIVSSETGEGVVFDAGPLPPGIAINSATGVISGTPQVAGTFYIPIQVSRRGATAGGELQMDFTGNAPIITAESELNPTVPHGGETTLSVSAAGLPEPSYQWYVGTSGNTEEPVSGANSSFFTTPPLTSPTSYWVNVFNNTGSVASSTFTVSVLPSTNANLSDLIPSNGAFSPAFNAGIFSYSVFVPNEVASIKLTPFAEVPQSSVAINGSPVALETESDPIDLVLGANPVSIVVTAGDGVTQKIHMLSIIRGDPPSLETAPATDITYNIAILRGMATPNGSAKVFFEYGIDETYGNSTPVQEISGSSQLDVQGMIQGLQAETVYHFRIAVTTGAGTIYGEDLFFETPIAPPLVATGDAKDETDTKVKLVGAVDTNGSSITVYFEYGETTAYGSTTPVQQVPASGNITDIQFVADGLVTGTTYHYRLVATTPLGIWFGEDVEFIAGQAEGGDGIPSQSPNATTGDATDVSTGSANLLGTANPKGGTTFVRFDYGLTDAYGSSTVSKGIGNGNSSAGVLINLSGLLPGRTYHYRLVASNSFGTTTGGDETFTTSFLAPLATTGAANPLSPTSARVSGLVRPRGTDADVFFEYGTDGITFPNKIRATPGVIGGDLETGAHLDLTSLEPRVTYFYRLTASRPSNPASTTFGEVRKLEADALYGLVQKFSREVPLSSRESVLTINLTPAGTGAWRFVGETAWRPSGVPVGGLTSGDRLIEYLPLPGFIQPPREQVGIVNGEDPQMIERTYFRTIDAGNASLRVILGPDSISSVSVPLASRAQWRISGETSWRDSRTSVSGLPAGTYLVEFKSIPGRNTPPGAGAVLINDQTTTVTIAYPPASAPILNPPLAVPFNTSSGSRNLPYSNVGQFRTDAGSQSGFVVKPRVVATTSMAIFNDSTLTRNTGMQWLHQRDKGTFEPKPQIPRGSYVFTGYEAQRISEGTPGTLSMMSQNLNVAALYFAEDAGRGGFSGYLASDGQANEFLQSAASKTMVGYPVNGISDAFQGRMHATPLSGATFAWEIGRTYSSGAIRGLGGMEGGPLCVRFQQGAYFPAAIYLGGTSRSIVRAIDGDVVDMFNRAELSGNGGDNNTGGGITHSSFTSIGATTTSALKVIIEPVAARNALAGWRLSPETSFRLSGAQKTGLAAGRYTLELKSVSGFETPVTANVSLTAGQLREITFTYQEANVAPKVNNVANVAISEDTSVGPLAVTLYDADDAENSLVLSAASSNPSLLPNGNINLAGSGAGRTVAMTPAPNQSGSAVITLTVSDGKLTGTDTFTLVVNPVNDPPTLSDISAQTLTSGTPSSTLELLLGDMETAAAALTITGESSNSTLIPGSNIVFSGSGADRTVTLTPLPGQLGSTLITLRVSDGGLTTERSFLLTVTGSALEIWRFTNFNTASNSGDAANAADPDGDGQSNLAEFAAGTNPNQAADVFRIASAIRNGTVFSTSVAGKAGRNYVLQRCPELAGGTWENVANSGTLAMDSHVSLTDSNATAARGFYRVVVLPAPP